MADSQLRLWISDQIFKFIGMSETTMVDYIYVLATSSKNSNDLYNSLQSLDMPRTNEVKEFANNLYSRVPHKKKINKEVQNRKKQTNDTINILKKNSSYKLLIEDEDEDEDSETNIKKKDKKSKKKHKRKQKFDEDIKIEKKKKKHIRKKNKDEENKEWESDSEEEKRISSAIQERYSYNDDIKSKSKYDDNDNSNEDDEYLNEEREKERDLKERDEFAERLKKKDLEKTKKIIEDHSSKADSEASKRRNIANDKNLRKQVLPNIREKSRQEYLRKREEQRLELLKKKVADEELLFKDVELTERERKEHEYDKQVLELATERMKINDKVDGYQMPEDYITEKGKIDKKKKESLLYERYQDDENQENFKSEQDKWEEQQVRK